MLINTTGRLGKTGPLVLGNWSASRAKLAVKERASHAYLQVTETWKTLLCWLVGGIHLVVSALPDYLPTPDLYLPELSITTHWEFILFHVVCAEFNPKDKSAVRFITQFDSLKARTDILGLKLYITDIVCCTKLKLDHFIDKKWQKCVDLF